MVKRPFLVPGVIGLAVITLSLINMMLFPQTALGQIEGIRSPIIAFEFAETKEEINTLFGVNGAPEQADFIRKMDQGNRLDYLYMLLYSGFLFSFALLAGKQTGQKWVYAGAVWQPWRSSAMRWKMCGCSPSRPICKAAILLRRWRGCTGLPG
ncbi:MAG: hypothetical protein M5U34_32385 [Chloroflexi bacterium]|nr:hypothetical protein [Chloroflexota bacterium]